MGDKINLERAKTDPSRAFDKPIDVVHCPSLSREQKLEVLKRWEFDARELSVAEEENMTGGEPNQLKSVVDALIAMGEEQKIDPTNDIGSPTKQGGA